MKQLTLKHVQRRLKYRAKQRKRNPKWGKNQPEVLTCIDEIPALRNIRHTVIPPAIRGFIRDLVE